MQKNIFTTTLSVVFFFLSNAFPTLAQEKHIDHQSQIWLQYFNVTQLNSKWSILFDGSYRWMNGFNERFQFLGRSGLSYKINDRFSIGGGYSYFYNYPNSYNGKFVKHEHRPWEQITHSIQFERFQLQNRLRLEQRWIKGEQEDKFHFNQRLRHQITLIYPLKGTKVQKGVPYLMLAEEVMLNFGKEILYNTFDQLRVHPGIGYGLSDNLNILISYQYIWQKRNKPVTFNSINCLRISLVHQLGLSKRKANAED